MIYKVPVDFSVNALNAQDASVQFDNFMRICYKEYAKLFSIVDYELPVGYPVDEYPRA